MNRLLDKLAILLICLIGFSMSNSFIAPVAALLFCSVASSAVQIFTGKKIAAVIIFVCCAMCAIVPIIFCAAALMIYDAFWEKKYLSLIPLPAVLFRLDGLTAAQLAISAAAMIVSVIFYLRVSKLQQTVDALMLIRDELAEKNIILAQQNVRILQAQDNEVYLAALGERNRIAREIHDNVGHMLTRSILQSGVLMVLNKDENLSEPLSSLKDTLDSAMTGIRNSVHNIHDDSIDLEKVMRESIASVDKRFAVTFDYDAGKSICGKTKLAIAGIVKEALSNAVKHSNGDRVTVIFREHPGFYQLMIEDNGVCKTVLGSGIGLKNMEERANGIGARISFKPSEKGFRIFMSVPKQI